MNHEGNRYRTSTTRSGKIIPSNDISIIKISNREMSLETPLCINTNNIYKFELVNKDKEKKRLTCKTISSFLRRTQSENGDNVPIYEVAIKFIELTDIEKQFLDSYVSEFANLPAIN
jgi:hypothetical protein